MSANTSSSSQRSGLGSTDADWYEGADEIEKAWRQGLRPDPPLTVSEWADRYRVLSQRAASEPGRWRTSRTPYLREIMDCLSPSSPVERVVLCKGAQVGGTECGNNWIGYVIHQAPGPMMAVSPTVELAKRNLKQRIDPLIEESEALKGLVKERRSRDSGNTVLSKDFPGGVLVLTGANSAVGLRSIPARYLFLDEVDGYPGDTDGESDPILLAERRVIRTHKGFPKATWEKDPTRRNEALDCRVYARAAAAVVGLDRFNERHWRERERSLCLRASPARQEDALRTDDAAPPSADASGPGRRFGGRRVIRSRWME